MEKAKKFSIPLFDKIGIINDVDEGNMSYELIKEKYKLKSSFYISTIISKKEKYWTAYKNSDPSRRSLKCGKFTNLDEALKNFICQSCNVGVAINDQILKVNGEAGGVDENVVVINLKV